MLYKYSSCNCSTGTASTVSCNCIITIICELSHNDSFGFDATPEPLPLKPKPIWPKPINDIILKQQFTCHYQRHSQKESGVGFKNFQKRH